MTAYQKLTPEIFYERLKNKDYTGTAGARRAVGKSDWKNAEKEKAKAVIDAHFGVEAGGSATTSGKPAKRKVAAKRAVKKASAAAPADKPKGKRGRPKKVTASSGGVSATNGTLSTKPYTTTSTGKFSTGTVPAGPQVVEEAARQSAASNVIAAYRGSGALTPAEQRAYDVANVEYAENISTAARRVFEAATNGIPTPAPLDAVSTPDGAPARVSVNGLEKDHGGQEETA